MRCYVLTIIFLSSLASMFMGCRSYEYSHKKKGQEVFIEPLYHNAGWDIEVIADPESDSSRGISGAEIALQGAQLAIQAVKELIKKSSEHYSHDFTAALNNLQVYQKNSSVGMLDPNGFLFQGFEIQRLITIGKKQQETAMSIHISVDESRKIDILHNGKFYLKLDSFDLNYTGAKINKRDWFLPWTWFFSPKLHLIDIDIEVEISANWIDGYGNIHRNVPFGYFVLPLRSIPFEPNSDELKVYERNIRGSLLSGSAYMIPRSQTFCPSENGISLPCFGRGDMNLLVRITESSKESYVSSVLQNHADELDGIKLSEKDLKNIQRFNKR